MLFLLLPAVAFAQETAPPKPTEAPAEVEAAKLSKVPTQTKFVEAEYPADAKAKGIEAEVVLLLDLDEQGKVASVGIAEPAQPADLGFDEAAMIAAQAWEFSPAEVDGKPIAVQITYKYRFTLGPAAPATAPGTPGAAPPTAPGGAPTAPAPARAAVVNFAGKLVERGTRLPMTGVVVTVFRDDGPRPVGFEASSDETGAFAFFDLAVGEWKVSIDAPGYYPFRTTEAITPGMRLDVTYHVERGSYNPYDVTVTAERPRKEVSRTVISAAEIDKVPGGAGDPLAVIENFAGVARTDFGGQIVVRGSAPEDTQVFIDGIGVPILFHFGGLKSVVPVGVLESIEFYPGNFSPAYGRATGGIIDVRIKQLKPKKIGGYVDVSILDTGVYLEVPLGEKGGVAIAGRRSYIDVLINALVPDDAGLTLATAPRYYDMQLLANYRPAPAHDLRLFAFGSDDKLKVLFDNPASIDPAFQGNSISTATAFYRSILTYRYTPSTTMSNDVRLAMGYDKAKFDAGQIQFDVDLSLVQLRDTARFQLTKRLALTLGLDVQAGLFSAFIRAPRSPQEGAPGGGFDLDDTLTTTIDGDVVVSPAYFAELEWSPIPGLVVLPGFRLDYFGQTHRWEPQPRLTARYKLDDAWTAKGGVGLFVQPPTFEETDDTFGNPDLDDERALHYSLGAEYKPLAWLTLDATAFYKRLDRLVSAAPTEIDGGTEQRPEFYDNGATGRVIGLELQARHELSHNLTGWLAYTLSRAERRDSGADEDRLFDFDQTHILTIVASYVLPRNWQVGSRFRLVSGNPSTPIVGSVYDATSDEYESIRGEVNSARDPLFTQFDLRVDKRWIYKSYIFGAYLDIQNALDLENPEGLDYNFDRTESKPEASQPIIGIIGLRAEF
jgi:TonB family protein